MQKGGGRLFIYYIYRAVKNGKGYWKFLLSIHIPILCIGVGSIIVKVGNKKNCKLSIILLQTLKISVVETLRTHSLEVLQALKLLIHRNQLFSL